MNSEKKILYFITETYSGNKMFFYNELIELAKEYDVRFISAGGYEPVECDIPGVTLYFYDNDVSKLQKVRSAFSYLCDPGCKDEKKNIMSCRTGKALKFFRSIEFYASARYFYTWFMDNVYDKSREDAIYYTYWCSYYALSMFLHRKECGSISKFITRLHEFDLYDETLDSGRQPFRDIINREEDRLIFVSQLSLDYYVGRHTGFDKSKAILNRLGTKKNSDGIQQLEDDTFTLVSCSTVDARKRVGLIIEALSRTDKHIRWVHFGDGVLYEETRKKAGELLDTKDNVDYEFMGRKPVSDIIEYYRNHKIHAFINVSSSEGCPVSIMEAMSFGIPIIATDAGEAEILTEGNGVFLENDASPADICDAIEKIYELTENNSDEYDGLCNASYTKWNTMFNVDNNIQAFINIIEKL